MFLVEKLLIAIEGFKVYDTEYEELCKNTKPELLAEWQSLSTKPQCNKNGTVSSVYCPDTVLMPTQSDILAQLTAQEQGELIINGKEVRSSNVTTLLADGFGIVESQLHIKQLAHEKRGHQLSSSEIAQLERLRSSVWSQIETWLSLAKNLLPSLASEYDLLSDQLGETGQPEEISLKFPSSFMSEQLSLWDLMEPARLERRLHEGQAYDALHRLRQALVHISGNALAHSEHTKGQKNATRAAHIINRQASDVHKHRDTYNHAREALCNLGMSKNDPIFRILKEEDLTIA
ncbi:hypothetical protein M422DRAFT_46024 [Sphaerobolus stellatus SS14]|uniref:Uncharacterized protein n=1 Tax=Sphaerobolus stellatus (strain SS14) TaxID=990650 RepID=A0A0C9W577_SPHS4|nr:hypothetical protein M422DRAFT_46024 [Sphaerobolus stellatus SS14]